MVNAVERFLDRLDRVKGSAARGWTGRCPAHEDRRASLSVDEGDDGRVLLRCHAGCTVEEILAALRLEKRDLFPERGWRTPSGTRATRQHSGCALAEYAAAKRLPADFLGALGIAEITYLRRPAVRIPYLTESGAEDAVRFRVSLDGDDKFRWKAGTAAKGKLYGLSRLPRARELGYTLLVEGESDAQSLWFHDFPAVALPGADMWDDSRNAPQLDGLDAIYVLIEPDKGGETILGWLRNSAIRERVRLVRLEVKDVSELHVADEGRFGERLEAALQSATPWADHERVVDDLRRRAAWSACGDLAREKQILELFGIALTEVGLVGEESAAKILYLTVTTRLFSRPTSVVVKGPSAAGKSFTVETVLRFFPEEAFYALSGMSEHALAYSTEPLVHRHLVLYEASALGAEFADYLVRTLLSEGRLRYETVEKTSAGLEARLIEREGPTGLVLTTTAIALHPENETRLLSVTVSDTAEQTRGIFLALAQEDDRREDDLLAPWLALQSWLASSKAAVTLPFARALAELVPPSAVRLRRDFGALLNLVRAHALIHQENRDRDEHGRTIATVEDYAYVRDLVADLLAEGVEVTVPPAVRETVEAVARLRGDPEDPDEGVSLSDLAKELGIDKGPASRRWQDARRRGYLKNLEQKRGRRARIVPDEPLPEDVEILPPPELLEECCRVAGNRQGVSDAPCHEIARLATEYGVADQAAAEARVL